MKRYSIVVLLGAVVLLNGCATGYQKINAFTISGGYKDSDLGRDVYRVGFGGNGYTTRETVQCFWLYRCAELALEKGYDGFEILSNIQLTEVVAPGAVFGSEVQVKPAGYVYVPVVIPMDNSYKPFIEADVHMLHGTIENQPPKVFDARKLKSALEPYVRDPIRSRGNVKPHVHEYLLPEGKLDRGKSA